MEFPTHPQSFSSFSTTIDPPTKLETTKGVWKASEESIVGPSLPLYQTQIEHNLAILVFTQEHACLVKSIKESSLRSFPGLLCSVATHKVDKALHLAVSI